jgi:predicted DsbA family dithiol-disulfide isomerase
MHRALFRAFFEEGCDLADPKVLEDVAAGVDLNPAALRADLEAGRHAGKVLEHQRLARELGISGVPAMLLRRADGGGRALMIGGAQPYEALAAAIEQLQRAPATSI